VNKRTKHIDIKYHFIREFIRSSRKIVLRTSVQRIKKCHYSLNMKLKSMTDFLLYGIKSMAKTESLPKTLVGCRNNDNAYVEMSVGDVISITL